MEELKQEELVAVKQPAFKARNFRNFRPTYAIGGAMVWKNKPKRKKTYPVVNIKSVKIREGGFVVREDVLEQSKELYQRLGELIPVALDAKNVLVNGYEQYLIAMELGHRVISYIPVKITKAEQRERRRRNKKREKRQRYNARKKKREKECKKQKNNSTKQQGKSV